MNKGYVNGTHVYFGETILSKFKKDYDIDIICTPNCTRCGSRRKNGY